MLTKNLAEPEFNKHVKVFCGDDEYHNLPVEENTECRRV